MATISSSIAVASMSPIVTGLTPPAGHPDGGDTVTIAGRGLSTAMQVRFGAAVTSEITVISATKIRVVTPAHPRGTVAIRVVTANRSESPRSSAARFTYTDAPAPLNWSTPAAFDPKSLYYGYSRISCANADVCIADPYASRGDQTAPVMLADGSWRRVQLPPSAAGSFTRADGSSCASPTLCLVVGWSGTGNPGQPTVWTWNGSDWSSSVVEPVVAQVSYWGRPICARGYSYCVVEDPERATLIYDGGQWTTATQQFEPISCASDTFCMVRTMTGDYAIWNGSVVGPGTNPFGNHIPYISCASAQFCLAVARQSLQDLEWTFDGVTWSSFDIADFTGYTTPPSCTTETSCWLINFVNGVSHAQYFDGQEWTEATRVSSRQQQDLSCWSSDGCRSVDRGANIASLSRGAWRSHQPIPRTGQPTDVSCASALMCIAVDRTGHAIRFDGRTWHAPEPIDVHRQLRSVSCPSVRSCMAIDNHGFAVRYVDGQWRTPTHVFAVDYPFELLDVSCASPDFCGAVVQDGRAAVYLHGRWHDTPRIVAQHGNYLNSVSCPAVHFCVAAGAGLSVYDGHWGAPLASSHGFYGVSCVRRFCATSARQVWMRNGGVLARSGVPASGRVICATHRLCLFSYEQSHRDASGAAVDGANWADAQIPGAPYSAGDCTKHFCMLLVGSDGQQETHSTV